MFQNGQITFSITPQRDTNANGARSLISSLDSESLKNSVTRTLAIPVEEQASCFFVQNFVHTPHDPTSRGWFDFLVPLIKTEKSDSHLSTAFSAVALASLANRPSTRGRGLMPQALALYTKALKQINLALQNPTQQKQDSTVASILLLGFFETITSERSNVLAWGSHIDGAVQLIKMRGKKQLRTKTGHALFVTVRTQMLIMVMSASKPPILGVDWWAIESPSDRGAIIFRLLLRVAELRAEINHCLGFYPHTSEHSQKVLILMHQAQGMELEFQDWMNSVPEGWRVKTAAWVDNVPGGDITKADVCPGKVDAYRDIFIAAMWNHSRISRLFLAGLVVRCAAWISSPADYRTTPQYATSARIGVDMVADIIASVPYLLGWRLDDDGQLKPGDLSGFTSGNDDITSAKALGGFFLTWPLFCAGCSDYATDIQRQWIKGRMNLISDVMGMNQAKTIGSFHVRLPSMVIRRDNMGVVDPSMARLTQDAITMSDIIKTPLYVPITAQQMIAEAEPKETLSQPSTKALNTIQHHVVLQREAFEKERKLLLRKASSFGGESAGRMIGDGLTT
ncbi:hypothetical protein D0Z07_7037 [Hyphodiscus hymeniophilus]|uniref:Uncharacterized protein n=1 Tax=Hyphodiscus hymeniophilus TaxID=353542 RepID=A0A9P6VFX7_9HELO|nr:hypothetical protein D0Z07_7037 [Hyphodiscus hymeniophilus]